MARRKAERKSSDRGGKEGINLTGQRERNPRSGVTEREEGASGTG
jgi:hypothetical protein